MRLSNALFLAATLVACGEPPPDPTPTPTPTPTPPPTPRPAAPARSPFVFDAARNDAAGTKEAPFSLTSSDGEGLALTAVRARAVVVEPLAFTELTLTFDNPENRVREGRFHITLPEGASLSRFAMKIGDRWQEGEVVERQAARRAYEDFLHRKQDPALLEQSAGNEFEARVFPIPARGQKELVVSYSHELVGTSTYVLPLRGLAEVGDLDVRVQLGDGASAKNVEEKRQAFVPDHDVVVDLAGSASGLRAGDLYVARVAPRFDAQDAAIGSVAILVDTSASRALGFDKDVQLVDDLLRALGRGQADTRVVVAAFDQTVAQLFDGAASSWGDEQKAQLRARRALGASDLAGALGWLSSQKLGVERVWLVSDGVATAGPADDALTAAAARLGDAGVKRLDAIGVGGIRDAASLKRLATALPQPGVVVDGKQGAVLAAERLTKTATATQPVDVASAAWWWPRSVEGMQPGDELIVYAQMPAGATPRFTVGGNAAEATTSFAEAAMPLVRRAIAKARIDALTDEHARAQPAERAALQQRIVELSTKERVLSSFTALLVLETEQDYARFHIDRKSLADVLTVGDTGVVVVQRGEQWPPWGQKTATATTRRPQPRPESPAKGRIVAAEGESESDGREGEERMKRKADEDSADVVRGLAGASSGYGAGQGGLAGPGGGANKDADDGVGLGDLGRTGGAAHAEEAEKSVASAPAAAMRPPPPPAPEPPPAPRDEAPKEDAMPEMKAEAPADEEAAPRTPPATTSPARARAPSPSRPRSVDVMGDDSVSNRPMADMPDAQPERQIPMSERGNRVAAYTGPFAEVMRHLRKQRFDDAMAKAVSWHEESPGDVLALVALGNAAAAKGDLERAARAYGSIIDLFPARADLRRYAGGLLESLNLASAHALALDSHAKAAEDRGDHPSSHHARAMSLVRAGRYEEALNVMQTALTTRYPGDRFRGAVEILREDAGLVAAAWIKAEPARADEIKARLKKIGGFIEKGSSVRFILTWETDANDVDFHIRDAQGNEAYYSQPELPTGGRLYADVTTGYGPECFTVRGKRTYPYTLEAHYYSRGPMGYGMGRLQIIEHDGKGGLTFEDRPFVVMQDDAFVDLGKVRGRLQ